ncbi:hypothetical protein BDN67DRAFT_657588 [Paxillus ammoniavirescens]|nr:hypothetical protein BDN67DRAFT_657588 [Paxillus ammoniavirescens]
MRIWGGAAVSAIASFRPTRPTWSVAGKLPSQISPSRRLIIILSRISAAPTTNASTIWPGLRLAVESPFKFGKPQSQCSAYSKVRRLPTFP